MRSAIGDRPHRGARIGALVTMKLLLRHLAGRGVFQLRRFVPVVLLGCAAATLHAAAQIAIPLVTGAIVDKALLSRDAHALMVWVLCLVGAATTSSVAKGIHTTAFTYLGEQGRSELQTMLLARLHALPMAFFDRERSGRIQSLLTEDASAAARLGFQVLAETLLGIVQLVLILAVLVVRYGGAIMAAVVLIPIYMLIPLFFSRRTRSAAREALAATGEVNTALHESLQAVREVRVFGREVWAVNRLRKLLSSEVSRQVRLALMRSIYALDYVLYFLVAGIVYWRGGLSVFAGRLTIGELVALVGLLAYLEAPVSRLTHLGAEYHRVMAATERVSELIQVEAGPQTAGGVELPAGGHRVRFEELAFRYGADGPPTLQEISFAVEPGELVAIVGPSGAGKSTLVGLLARLYEPQKGRILVDDQDLQVYSLDSLRREIGFVLQDTMLFAGSVRENIRFGKLDATDEEIEDASRMANADRFIQCLPSRYESEVGERGVQLSGGQRQRIGIARVLLRKPGILVLDEATSALDAEAERLVQEALEQLMRGRTTFVVSHRPSAFIHADRIVVLDGGRMVATGRHGELLARSEVYRGLVGERTAGSS